MALREITDERGMQWSVFAVQPVSTARTMAATRAELAQGWLCFQCDTERRRLPGIPTGWESMGDPALLSLLSEAPVAPQVSRARRGEDRTDRSDTPDTHG
jgi:hypothetical protein